MDTNEYSAAKLKEMAQATARENGGRLVRWSILPAVDNPETTLVVYYKPRHWRHCPGCQTGNDGHVGPKGEPVKELETATVVL